MRRLVIGAALAFLYGPLLAVTVYAFNDSRLVTVWTGFSVRWFGELLTDRQLLRAIGLSLGIAAIAATVATVIGAAAGLALARFGPFRGRTLFAGMLAAPLVMPEIITGLSLLLLFVAAAQVLPLPGRGLWSIVIGHTTLAVAYVAVIVQARARGNDRALEEAAADLGASPAVVLWRITVPLLAPALAAGWLLAFVLSFDDLVIASFLAGPQATTLPMAVFSAIRLGVSPKINALATLLLLATGLILALATILGRRSLRSGLPERSAAMV
jgi:putrescine transport system permease protein